MGIEEWAEITERRERGGCRLWYPSVPGRGLVIPAGHAQLLGVFFRLGMLLAREELHCCTTEDGRRKAPARPFGKWSLIGRQNAALMARSLSSPKF